jgi:hypothetical protein
MKRLVALVAVMMAAACMVQADLAPGTTIEDYLPVITATTVDWGGEQYQYQGGLEEYEVEGTKFKLKGSLTADTGFGIITLEELEYDPDPYVFVSQLIYNNTLIPQTYQILIDQPAYLATSSSLVYGSVVVSLLDEANDGASLSDNNRPIYTAYIDDNEVDTLLDDPYTLVAPTTVNSGLQEFGWNNYGAGVVSNIAIEIEFTLSPGDSATVQGSFEVIPEPASLILIGLTAATFTFIRRRFIG